MKKYDYRDTVTMYIVYATNDKGSEYIFGWTDDKQIIEMVKLIYSDMKYRIEKVVDEMSEIVTMINQNVNDELKLYPLITRGKNGKATKVSVPLTLTLYGRLNEETANYGLIQLDEYVIERYVGILKKEYIKALNVFNFQDIVMANLHSQESEFASRLQIDELKLLIDILYNGGGYSGYE